ncbi:MAG: sulfite oxidase [Pirellulales bacterium]
MNRRDFLHSAAAVALAARYAAAAEEQGRTAQADAFIKGKDARLIVHNDEVGELETPLELLREHAQTPKEVLFVRNNQILPGVLTTAPAEPGDWSLELAGLLDKPQSVALTDLARLPQEKVELVLQCSGNGRALFSRAAKTSGAQWQRGAMGNVVFQGVPLRVLLRHAGASPLDGARYLTAEGADTPGMEGAADFEHSLPLADALSRSIVALRMNGEPLPRVHGGPLRLVTPGFYGTMHVKWLTRLRFEESESTNHHHVGRYRTPLTRLSPGDKFSSTLENSEPNWQMRIKSVIFAPLDGDLLAAGRTTIRGVAWNDGTARIDGVEVSVDGGQTWRQAQLRRPDSPYAWHPWSIEADLPAGQQTILARATDALGRTQPLDGSIHWNPAGYTWNGVERIEVTVG